MLNELCAPIERVDDLDWNQAERLVRGNLAPLEIAG
jgi:hypothetical protein